jgi:hypothetical protein
MHVMHMIMYHLRGSVRRPCWAAPHSRSEKLAKPKKTTCRNKLLSRMFIPLLSPSTFRLFILFILHIYVGWPTKPAEFLPEMNFRGGKNNFKLF